MDATGITVRFHRAIEEASNLVNASGRPGLANLAQRASEGDHTASHALGTAYRLYAEGQLEPVADDPLETTPRDDLHKEALRWVQKAAESGYSPAMFDLALACASGAMGLTKDPTSGAKWMRRAAEAGDVDAATEYGAWLWHGGERKNAVPWLEVAAAGAQAKAHGLLALYYGPISPQQALFHLLVARRLGERESDGWRAAIDQGIADIGEPLSKMDAEIAQRRADSWRPRLT